MTDPDIIPFLKTIEIFKGLSDENLTLLLPFLKINRYEKGSWILREGDTGEDLLFIKSGKAEVVKGEERHPVQIAVLEPGEWTGEMSFIEKEKRSASVRALEPTEILILMGKDLHGVSSHETIYYKIIQHLAKKISRRLRNVDESLVTTLKEKIQLTRLQDEVGRTLVYVFLFMALYLNLTKLYNILEPVRLYKLTLIFYPITVVVLGVLSILIINSSESPFAFYGLTIKNGIKNAWEGIVFSIPILIGLFILKWILIEYTDEFQSLPFIELKGPKQTWDYYILYIVIYVLLVPIQELMVRSFLQTSFRNFFQGSSRGLYAILISNVLYNIFHTATNVWLSVITFFFGIFWGLLFERQKSIVGCTVSHVFLGVIAFFILDYDLIIGISELHSP